MFNGWLFSSWTVKVGSCLAQHRPPESPSPNVCHDWILILPPEEGRRAGGFLRIVLTQFRSLKVSLDAYWILPLQLFKVPCKRHQTLGRCLAEEQRSEPQRSTHIQQLHRATGSPADLHSLRAGAIHRDHHSLTDVERKTYFNRGGSGGLRAAVGIRQNFVSPPLGPDRICSGYDWDQAVFLGPERI